jgi:hypothetical protein
MAAPQRCGGTGRFSLSLKTITMLHKAYAAVEPDGCRFPGQRPGARLGGRRRVRDELPVVVMLSYDDGAKT